ncbi:MAG TPA: DNA mismatch repair protein MutS [Flavobacteriaceae bacterium]|nr:DNA mismatch repair protein MutS [Flavobacteriaceae bacterium]
MIKISEKTLKDLEFHTVREQIAELCITDLGKAKTANLVPFKTSEETLFALNQTNEHKSSAFHETRIPNHGFEPIEREIRLLEIEGSILELSAFRKISHLSETANNQISYFKKYNEFYPTLFETTQRVDFTTELLAKINKIIDRFGEIKNDASPLLQSIRASINAVKSKINSSFVSDLTKYNSAGYLDEIKESVVNDIRVLAVSAMYRRKVKGAILGSSKSGGIVYVQPEATMRHSRDLNNLEYEEKEEIKRILKSLTEFVRPYTELLKDYCDLLSDLDLISAKANYAERLNAVLPKISENRELELKAAFHPLLYLSNQKKGEKTFSQDIYLNPENRILVISGPNAGGKSITLKTVGLLQIMLQSGILVPVHEFSGMCFFNKILTDIGDNQSIENHLSTYSYRLKNMKKFLRKCDDKTLFLIDEFGTGSDPELGGALAETFLEVFHERKSYGIITTHYANLKKMANETEGITNANMLFDGKSLEPKYKLQLGEAGSSFTFEVAQKNGIPYSLINRSKKKVERGKIRFDRSIANLQKERSLLSKTTSTLKTKEQKAAEEHRKLEITNEKIQRKLESFQELFDTNQRLIYLGQKLDDLSEKYFNNKRKKELSEAVLKLVEIENSKRKKQTKNQRSTEKAKTQKLKKEVEKKVEVIREKKKKQKKIVDKEKEKKIVPLKENDRVRLHNGKAVGTIDKIEKGKATVNYGMFTTLVSLQELEKV